MTKLEEEVAGGVARLSSQLAAAAVAAEQEKVGEEVQGTGEAAGRRDGAVKGGGEWGSVGGAAETRDAGGSVPDTGWGSAEDGGVKKRRGWSLLSVSYLLCSRTESATRGGGTAAAAAASVGGGVRRRCVS